MFGSVTMYVIVSELGYCQYFGSFALFITTKNLVLFDMGDFIICEPKGNTHCKQKFLC